MNLLKYGTVFLRSGDNRTDDNLLYVLFCLWRLRGYARKRLLYELMMAVLWQISRGLVVRELRNKLVIDENAKCIP